MSEFGSIDARDFRDNAEFVRRLARRLIADQAAAEDLAQDTWVAALEQRPHRDRSLRSWLARVLRNQAALRLRRAERRSRREAATAGADQPPDGNELLERTELHARILQATLELPESYRVVLLRHFWNGETPAEMARELGCPEATVRTRLRRGLERVRERLRADPNFQAGLFLTSLGKLAGEPTPPVGLLAPLTGTQLGTLLVTAVSMKKALALAAVAVLAVLYWMPRGPGAPVALEVEDPLPEQVELRAPVRPEPSPELRVAAMPAAGVPDEEPPAEEEVDATPSPALTEPGADQEERGWLTFFVRDIHGTPIPRAEIKMSQFSADRDNGSSSSYAWLLEESAGATDLEGKARLWFPYSIAETLQQAVDINAVGFSVLHPDYVTHTEPHQAVLGRGHEQTLEITLVTGSLIVVSGWMDSPSEVITDVKIRLDSEVQAAPTDWIALRDGRLSCATIPPGFHYLHLFHEGPEGTWHSEVAEFELGEGEQRELHLQLHPPHTFVGELADSVPRPIVGGQVHLSLSCHAPGRPAVLYRTYEADIDAKGRFEFKDLPPGTGEVVALCDGWATPTLEGLDEAGQPARWLQGVDTASWMEGTFVLPMEPTGTAEVTLVDEAGRPVPDAVVNFHPNVHWSNGYSTVYVDRAWHGTSDATGRVLVPHLPAGPGMPWSAVHPELGLENGRLQFLEVHPARTARVTVTMTDPD